MSEIKNEVQTLADQIKGKIEFDATTGIATLDKEFYKSTLPEAVTVECIEALQDHNTLLAAAAGLAMGEKSIDFMKKHKDVAKTELAIPMVGKDKFNAVFTRSRPIPGNEDGAVTYGSLKVGFDHYGTRNAGELKKVKAMLSEKAAKALAD